MSSDQHQPAAAAPGLSEAEIEDLRGQHTASGRLKRSTDGHPICDEDEWPWPCSTIRALDDLARTRAEADALKAAYMDLSLRSAYNDHANTCGGCGPDAQGCLHDAEQEALETLSALAAPHSEQPPAAPVAPSAEASDPSWIRRGFSATVHGRSWPYVTCLDCGWLTYTDSPTVVHHTADCPHATTPPDHQAGDEHGE